MSDQVTPTAIPKPVVPSPDVLYDDIMEKIEPELTSKNIPNLDQLYAADTPEQKRSRAERYKRAFVAYANALQEYKIQMKAAIQQYFKLSLRSMETQDAERNEVMQNMDSLLLSI